MSVIHDLAVWNNLSIEQRISQIPTRYSPMSAEEFKAIKDGPIDEMNRAQLSASNNVTWLTHATQTAIAHTYGSSIQK